MALPPGTVLDVSSDRRAALPGKAGQRLDCEVLPEKLVPFSCRAPTPPIQELNNGDSALRAAYTWCQPAAPRASLTIKLRLCYQALTNSAGTEFVGALGSSLRATPHSHANVSWFTFIALVFVPLSSPACSAWRMITLQDTGISECILLQHCRYCF